MQTVVELRRAGNKVRVIHSRWNWHGNIEDNGGFGLMSEYEAYEAGLDWEPLPYGGLTSVEVTTQDGQNKIGEALCSINDNYNRKFGVQKALARALGVEPALTVHGETRRLLESV